MTNFDPALSYRLDAESANLTRAFAGILTNSQTGLGTSRDKSQYTQVNPVVRSLTERELSGLYRKSGVIQRAVSTYPYDANQSWVSLELGTSNLKNEDFDSYFSSERMPVTLRSAITDAGVQSRWHGDGFILIFVADGRETWEPIDFNRIGSIRSFLVVNKYEIFPIIKNARTRKNPEFYQLLMLDEKLDKDLKDEFEIKNTSYWHRDRVIRIPGVELDTEGLSVNNGYNDSIIQSMYESFCAYYPGIQASSIMVQDHRRQKYGIKNLAELADKRRKEKAGSGEKTNQNGQDFIEAIQERLVANAIAQSVAKATVFDSETETWEQDSNEYGGLDGIIDKLLESWTMNTDMSRLILYNLLGSNGLASGEAFKFARLDHGYRLNSWMERKLRSPIEYIYKLGMLAKDSPSKGKIIDGWAINIPILYKMTEEEKLTLQEQAARRDTSYIGLGVVSAKECRKQFETANFHPAIVLEPGAEAPADIQAKKEEAAAKKAEKDAALQAQSQAELTQDEVQKDNMGYREDAPRIKIPSFKIRPSGRTLNPRLVLRGAGGRFAGSVKRLGVPTKKTKFKKGILKADIPTFYKEIKAQALRTNNKDPKELIALGKKFSDRHLKTGAKTKEFQKLFTDITHYHGISQVERKALIKTINFDPKISTWRKQHITTNTERIIALTGSKGVPKHFVFTENRAFAHIEKKLINVGERYSSKELFHETGHLLEADNKDLAIAAERWRASRATGKATRLKDLGKLNYDDDEIGIPGKFIHEYVGKIYPNGYTEVYSKGLENFDSIPKLQSFYRTDPEHFHLTVGALLSDLKASPSGSVFVPGTNTSPAIAKKVAASAERVRRKVAKQPTLPATVTITKPQNATDRASQVATATSSSSPEPKTQTRKAPSSESETGHTTNQTFVEEKNFIKNFSLNPTLTATAIAGTGTLVVGSKKLTSKEKKKRS